MKQWSKEVEIQAPIERVWRLFDGSLEKMQKIMPQVVSHTPVKITQEGVGTIYHQQYKEGSRIQEYDVETLQYADDSDYKRLKVGFTLAGLFEITADYELSRAGENGTRFKYTVTNRPLKWFVRLFLWFASDKVVDEFLARVKRVAETEI